MVRARRARPGRRRARAAARVRAARGAQLPSRRVGHRGGRHARRRARCPRRLPRAGAGHLLQPLPGAARVARLAGARPRPGQCLDRGLGAGRASVDRLARAANTGDRRPAAGPGAGARASAHAGAPALGARQRHPRAAGRCGRFRGSSSARTGAVVRARGARRRLRAGRSRRAAAHPRCGNRGDRGRARASGGARRVRRARRPLRCVECPGGCPDVPAPGHGRPRRVRVGPPAAGAPVRRPRAAARGRTAPVHEVGSICLRHPAPDLAGAGPGGPGGRHGWAGSRLRNSRPGPPRRCAPAR